MSVENRWARAVARVLSHAASLRVTALYAVALVTVAITLSQFGSATREVVVSQMSTNLHNLSHGRLSTLVGSAFVSDGDNIAAWLPGLVCLLALGELIWRGRGLLLAFAVGHVGATLLVAIWLTFAVQAGWLPTSIAHATDVGVSYGAVSVLGALTASIPSRWRAMWAGWWLGVAVTAALSMDFTTIGHVLALLLGIGLSFRLPSLARWTPLHSGLFLVAVAFVYFVLCGPTVEAVAGGLTGTLFGFLASPNLRPFAKSRVPLQQPEVVAQPC
ncbi:rhomboid-like protein [Mycobacterium shigaense]|nr:rhomboid-like protein [Mycobacterium shigaense]MEA1121722.1 rhomboid-like protein [Mycobacterium shigaense]